MWLACPKTCMCRISSHFKPFSHVEIDIFFILLSGRISKQPKISHFVDFEWEKCTENGLSCTYWGLKMCQIQWYRFWVSMISGSWKIKIWGKYFTFCWFWLGKMLQNGLSGTYLGFKVYQIQWHRFQVSMISGSWKIKISGKTFTICWF